ncbi:MAG: DUF262 domain-containing protein [Pseudohongiellaceae bacterium]
MTTNNSISEGNISQLTAAKEEADKEDADKEEIDGLQDSSGSLSGYPIDKLLIRQESRTIYEVIRRIEDERYIMDPDFQRGVVWDKKKQSRLIESVIMRIPLPVFYLAEDNQGRMIVVDGLQRLTTFHLFRNNKLKLNLPEREELDGRIFDDLIPKYQNRIEDFNLIFYVIDPRVEDRARLDIFERVNGGVPLSRQQMRNALYSGPATIFLRKEAESDIFKRATGNSLKREKMRDREFVNRFCSFYLLGMDAYNGNDMDGFLSKGLKKMNSMTEEKLENLSKDFQRSLTNNLEVFGRHAFRKSISWVEYDGRSVLNASLWDVMSTELARHTTQHITSNKIDIETAIRSLLDDKEFNDTITLGTNNVKKVHTRFEMVQEVLGQVL